MKNFSRTAGAALLTILALQGCSTNPSLSGGGSIQDFARNLNGQTFNLRVDGLIWVPSRSGELVTAQNIPKGLMLALEPATEHCKRAGGDISFTNFQLHTPTPVGQPQLPLRALCQKGATLIWALDMSYPDARTESVFDDTLRRTFVYLRMTVGAQLLSADQYAGRLQEEQAQAQARDKAAAAQRERQAAVERERQQRTKDQEAEARRIEAQWSARVAAFQANLKVGDRFQWAKSFGFGGPFVGVVVRLEGTLAFVQFDSLTISGQPTRYLPKVELEPLDRPTPNSRRTID